MSAPSPAKPPAARPQVIRGALWLLLLLVSASGGAAVGMAWWRHQAAEVPPGHSSYGTGTHDHEDARQRAHARQQDALARLEELAHALRRYRDGPLGGGLRWPMALDELNFAGLTGPEVTFTGVLSGRPLLWQPEAPPGHDPARWVMCADVEVGWVHGGYRGFRAAQGIRGAAVILGDGNVRWLEAGEFSMYGGISTGMDVPR
jgi:hypothetical protein